MQYTQEELNKILKKHMRWIVDGSDGEKACLRWVNLREAFLKGADLRNVNLSWADLTEADLRNINLRETDLSETALIGANLMGADLRGAKIDKTSLTWVNTEGIKGYTVYCVQMPTSRENARLSYWKELDIWTTGCFQGTKEELINSINETHKDNEKIRNRYFKAIAFIESLASEE